jgi:2-amino-4-hydroxy-6-hydroxymethyldihydropteridine diphosphokinase
VADSAAEARLFVVGLGANLGDRRACLQGARDAIEALPATEVLAASQLSETAPVGGPPQGAYLNGALLVRSALTPTDLMARLLDIERSFGRERRERWGPRTLDLDLLFSPGLLLDEPTLTMPHPRLTERRFALAPLVEVAPWAADPHTGVFYREILDGLPPG